MNWVRKQVISFSHDFKSDFINTKPVSWFRVQKKYGLQKHKNWSNLFLTASSNVFPSKWFWSQRNKWSSDGARWRQYGRWGITSQSTVKTRRCLLMEDEALRLARSGIFYLNSLSSFISYIKINSLVPSENLQYLWNSTNQTSYLFLMNIGFRCRLCIVGSYRWLHNCVFQRRHKYPILCLAVSVRFRYVSAMNRRWKLVW